ncbi:hypothetical protein FHS04_001016 [Mesoflavibacter sabulilitoris]|uniref:Uncharacterized protein n=1 Tax=Mesoflavibacter zeaxanthinifaciens subsp. sabulilitoris TaxID=1520893 RepID=A0A2T1NB32_9FLAO|nr:hypothetical protein [Mesoflavibacter zeaxanthinifaciens subsp. sabulilitoris]PSG89356.1 hypothetical protein C7H61_10410 [Mesoflavibacter zeaxanthinifaciens subsp. sabulilitoris]
MIIFNYIFFSIYKSISITNNWWPKKSTISAITVLLYFNLLTIVAFLNEEILKTKILFFFIFIITFVLPHFYYYKKGRLEEIIEKFEEINRKKLFKYDLLVLTYVCASVYLFFYSLNVGNEIPFILISIILITSLYSYLKIVRFD